MLASQPMTESHLPSVYKVARSDIRSLSVASIQVPEERERSLDEAALADLDRSIEAHGLLQPLGVKLHEGATWRLIWGLHRFTVWKRKYQAGLKRFEETGDPKERDRWAN